jgi:hypothetical protein
MPLERENGDTFCQETVVLNGLEQRFITFNVKLQHINATLERHQLERK